MRTVLLCLLIAGCATWDNPNKTEAQFWEDLYQCEVQAAPVQNDWRVMQMKNRCMRLKGWVQR